MKIKLMNHVKTALDQGTVITNGRSYFDGLWDSEAPQLPIVMNDGTKLDWSNSINKNDHDNATTTTTATINTTRADFNFTSSQKKLAMKLAKLVKRKGIMGSNCSGDNTLPPNMLVFRRFGYTKEENPERMCALLMNSMPLDMFQFKGELTYDLDEVLNELFKVVQQINGMPPFVHPDELKVVEPLRQILNESFQEAGVETVRVHWYPPPSPEETRYTDMTNPMTNPGSM